MLGVVPSTGLGNIKKDKKAEPEMMLVLRFLILRLAISLLTRESREATADLDEQIRTLIRKVEALNGRISNVVNNRKTKRTTPKEYN